LSCLNRTLSQIRLNSTGLTYKQDSVCKSLRGCYLLLIAVCRFLPLPPLCLPYRFMGGSFFRRFHICHRRASEGGAAISLPYFCSSKYCRSSGVLFQYALPQCSKSHLGS